MAHRHRQRRISALLGRQPDIAKLGHLAKVRRHRHRLGALVAHLGVKMRIRRAGHRDIRTPHHQVIGVVPVSRFGHVGLLAPNLRAGRRQITVPVVKRQRHAANQAQVTAASGVRHHRHRRNRRKTNHPIRAVILDGVGIGGGDDLVHLVPAGAHKAALAALGFVLRGDFRRLADPLPGLNRPQRFAQLAPVLHQHPAHHRVLHPLRRIHIPAIRRPTRTTARLVVGQIWPRARIVGLLRLPGDQPVFDVHLPTARPGAVHPMRGAHDLVVLPALAVSVLPLAVFLHHRTVAIGESGFHLAEKIQSVEKMAHACLQGGWPGQTARRRYRQE